jgi:hypothetical protein
MRPIDWLVVTGCLVGGYWVVSFFIDRGQRGASSTAEPPKPEQAGAQRPDRDEADGS